MTSSVSGHDMMQTQSGATIMKPIIAGQVDALRTFLKSIGDDIPGNPHIPFTHLGSAHFMSWFIVDGPGVGPFLFLEINVDGPIEAFLRDLIAKAGPGVDRIYRCCAGYPAGGAADADPVVRYLLADNIGYDCYYICWRGLTVDRILRERKLRADLEPFLNKKGDPALAAMDPAAIRAMVQDYVRSDPALAWARTFPPRPFLVRYRSLVLTALAVLAGLAVVGIIAWGIGDWHREGPEPDLIVAAVAAAIVLGLVGLLRWHEVTDSVSDAQPDHSQVATVVTQENRVVQNHFASFVDVKPGMFRAVLLKTVLKLIHVLAAISSNQGNLSGIKSIHFARWVVFNGGKQLLFLSNYDGSWEKYLDDFIDQASDGLTAVWSNTVGFPRSSFLVGGGARDELLFKTLVRRSQTASLVWYSAYPDLSTENIQANAAIREGLFVPMESDAEAAWLANF